jgi:hypothetical protein
LADSEILSATVIKYGVYSRSWDEISIAKFSIKATN